MGLLPRLIFSELGLPRMHKKTTFVRTVAMILKVSGIVALVVSFFCLNHSFTSLALPVLHAHIVFLVALVITKWSIAHPFFQLADYQAKVFPKVFFRRLVYERQDVAYLLSWLLKLQFCLGNHCAQFSGRHLVGQFLCSSTCFLTWFAGVNNRVKKQAYWAQPAITKRSFRPLRKLSMALRTGKKHDFRRGFRKNYQLDALASQAMQFWWLYHTSKP